MRRIACYIGSRIPSQTLVRSLILVSKPRCDPDSESIDFENDHAGGLGGASAVSFSGQLKVTFEAQTLEDDNALADSQPSWKNKRRCTDLNEQKGRCSWRVRRAAYPDQSGLTRCREL